MDIEYTATTTLVSDGDRIGRLLHEVYVGGGYTDAEIAGRLFEPAAVFDRGLVFAAREPAKREIVGVVILVNGESKACRMAEKSEAELHLLAVGPEFRGNGIARALTNAAIAKATEMGKEALLLWTQESMKEARLLYESLGFFQVRDFEQGDRRFTVYRLPLTPGSANQR